MVTKKEQSNKVQSARKDNMVIHGNKPLFLLFHNFQNQAKYIKT